MILRQGVATGRATELDHSDVVVTHDTLDRGSTLSLLFVETKLLYSFVCVAIHTILVTKHANQPSTSRASQEELATHVLHMTFERSAVTRLEQRLELMTGVAGNGDESRGEWNKADARVGVSRTIHDDTSLRLTTRFC